MERREFYFLYINLSSLAELALRQLAARVLAQPAGHPAMDESFDDGPDIAGYLERAYGYEEELRERIDHCYLHANLPSLQAGLQELPGTLNSLASELTAAQMAEWLDLHARGHAALTELVTHIRRLDIGAGKALLGSH